MVKGSVTISIEDFQAFLETTEKSKIMQEKFLMARKELQVFLSFLVSREDLEKYVDEFNRQSKTSTIIFENGAARIDLKDDQKNIKEI